MQIVRDLGGYSFGRSDLVRRAMSKKKMDVMLKEKEYFIHGKLADDAGCRGLRVGGAFVSDRHANVIAAGPDATASDVLALVDLVRSRVRAATGIDLRPEIRVP